MNDNVLNYWPVVVLINDGYDPERHVSYWTRREKLMMRRQERCGLVME